MSLLGNLSIVHDVLEKENIEHALIGGLALGIWGVGRATNDIDLLTDENNRDKIKRVLSHLKISPFFESEEVLQYHGAFNLDFLFARRPLSREILMDAITVNDPISIKCVRVEDLIGLKIQAYKNAPKRELQDKADIQMLFGQNLNLDMVRIKRYADLFGEWETVEKLKTVGRS